MEQDTAHETTQLAAGTRTDDEVVEVVEVVEELLIEEISIDGMCGVY